MKYLICVDGSARSYQNVGLLCRLLKESDSVVVYYHDNTFDTKNLQEHHHLTPQQLVNAVTNMLCVKEVTVHSQIDEAASEKSVGILNAAIQNKADFVALGHPRTASIITRILTLGYYRSSNLCTQLFQKQSKFQGCFLVGNVALPNSMPRSYLLLVDGTDAGYAAATMLRDLIEPEDVVHVHRALVQPALASALYEDDDTWKENRRKEKRLTQQLLARTINILKGGDSAMNPDNIVCSVEEFVWSESAAIDIIRKQCRVDVIVLGNSHASSWTDWFYSPTVVQVLTQSNIALLVSGCACWKPCVESKGGEESLPPSSSQIALIPPSPQDTSDTTTDRGSPTT